MDKNCLKRVKKNLCYHRHLNYTNSIYMYIIKKGGGGGGGGICRHSETIKKVKIDNAFTGMKVKRSTVCSCNIQQKPKREGYTLLLLITLILPATSCQALRTWGDGFKIFCDMSTLPIQLVLTQTTRAYITNIEHTVK